MGRLPGLPVSRLKESQYNVEEMSIQYCSGTVIMHAVLVWRFITFWNNYVPKGFEQVSEPQYRITCASQSWDQYASRLPFRPV